MIAEEAWTDDPSTLAAGAKRPAPRGGPAGPGAGRLRGLLRRPGGAGGGLGQAGRPGRRPVPAAHHRHRLPRPPLHRRFHRPHPGLRPRRQLSRQDVVHARLPQRPAQRPQHRLRRQPHLLRFALPHHSHLFAGGQGAARSRRRGRQRSRTIGIRQRRGSGLRPLLLRRRVRRELSHHQAGSLRQIRQVLGVGRLGAGSALPRRAWRSVPRTAISTWPTR